MNRGPIECRDAETMPDRVAQTDAQNAASHRTFPRGARVAVRTAEGDVHGRVTRCERNELMRITVVSVERPCGSVLRVEASRVRHAKKGGGR